MRANINRMSQRGSFTQRQGPTMPGIVREASTRGAKSPPWSLLKVPIVFREIFPRGKFLKSHLPSGNSGTISACPHGWHTCHSDRVDPHLGFQIPFMWEKSDWAVLPAQALFEIDGNSSSFYSKFLPRASLLPPKLFSHSRMKELSLGYRVQATLRRSSWISWNQRLLEMERTLV